MHMIDPNNIFEGVLVIVAPHMDDAVIACGGTISKLSQKNKVHIIYATDGAQSPKSIMPWHNKCFQDLNRIRIQEAKEALNILGVPEKNLHFFNFPDGKLKNYSQEFSEKFINFLEKVEATHVLIPFLYDSHTDHLAVNRLTTKAIQENNIRAIIFEYFVYYNFRLLPGKDMRKYINPNLLLKIDIQNKSAQKRKALLCFKSQVAKFYDCQQRPILSQAIIDDVCENKEIFFCAKNKKSKNQEIIFQKYGKYIPVIHFLEPALKKIKDQILLFIKSS